MTQKSDAQMVMVVWADAHADGDGWTPREDIETDGELLVETCGFLLTTGDGGKEHHVTIAQSITPHDDIDHILHIPQGMVRTITFLKPFTIDLTI